MPDRRIAREDVDDLFSLAYEELRRLASTIRRHDPRATMTPTALVNGAWMKLAQSPAMQPESQLHFKRIAARAMRQLLIESARARHAEKRGGPDAIVVTFDEERQQPPATSAELLDLDEALDRLAAISPRQAQVVECRYFGGLDVAETAAALEVSEATILRDWRAAKAWLANAVRPGR